MLLSQAKAAYRMSKSTAGNLQKLLGWMQHAALAIPAGCSILLPLHSWVERSNAILTVALTPHKVLWNPHPLTQALIDFTTLLQAMASHPMLVWELVPGVPVFIGVCDTSYQGADGI